MDTRTSTTHLNRRTRHRLVLTLAAVLCLTAMQAEAAYYRAGRRAFLQVGDLYQRLSFGYDFSNHVSSSDAGDSDFTSHDFEERYTLGFAWAVYNPRILKGQLSLTGNMHQRFESSSAGGDADKSDDSLLYRLEGVFLEPKPYPVHFSLYGEENIVRNAFSPSYTVSSRGESVSFNYKNRYLPFSAAYSQSSSSTSGGGRDTTTEGRTYSLGLGHSFRWSDTNLTWMLEQQTIDSGAAIAGREMDRMTLDIQNVLHREQRTAGRRELMSRYRLQEERGTNPYTRKELRENLSWQLGRGFSLTGSYSIRDDQTDNGFSKTTGSSVSITHTMYQNLRTTLHGSWSDGQTTGGETSARTAGLGLSYSKRLGDDGNLSLGYSFSQTQSEQSYRDATVAVNFEEHTVPAAADLPDPTIWEFSLGPDVVSGTAGDIVVRNANHSWTYSEGVDYEVVQMGADTVIRILDLPRAGLFSIDYGSTLLVSYRRKVNMQLSSSSSSHGVTAALARNGGRYIVSFDATKTTTAQEGGSDTLGQTRDSLSAGLRIALNYGDTRYYLMLRHVDTADTVTEMLSGTWTHQISSYYGNASFAATETYTTSRAGGGGGGNSWANAATFSGTFSRSLNRRVGMKLDGRYENRLDDVGMRHRLSLGAELKSRLGRSWINFGVNSYWTLDDQLYSRNTTLYLNYSRTF